LDLGVFEACVQVVDGCVAWHGVRIIPD
jgi:hypothetical protein